MNVSCKVHSYLFLKLVFYFCCFNYVCSTTDVNFTEPSSGLWPDCPGSQKPAVITPESLFFLNVRVGGVFRRIYNYYHMRNLVRDPDINFSRKTVLFSIGYLNTPSAPYARLLVPHYLDLDYNVLVLDNSRFMLNPYPMTARFIKTVGFHTAEMLVELTKYGLNPKRLELLGVSLGAQQASFIAKAFKELTGVKVSRLTGLDPAGPCFRNREPEGRIDKTDADFVDIVSTNIHGFGMEKPVGHVHFYVNGGDYQPGDGFWLLCNVYCSHVKSMHIWMAALKNQHAFIAIKCDSVRQARLHQCYDREPRETNVLGLEVDRNKAGIFYLATGHNYPYFLGKRGLLKENQFFASRLGDFNENDLIRV